ncbi:glycosyltransferase, partial [Lacisediminimonas sp.]|uniref:glycosyltransferase n=1 Tax=Lacisediminimonas sp. TaxID=3060582 RepID=UPI0027239076
REFCQQHQDFALLENQANLGYTRTMNRGLAAVNAPWVVMLNSDTLVSAGWLAGLLRCIGSDPAIGIVGPLSNAASWQNVPLLRNDSQEFAVNRLPAGLDVAAMARLVASASARRYPRVPVLNGFCLLLRRSLLQTLGPLDAGLFPHGYGEENDYCLRAADAGYALAVADDVYVHHAKSASFGQERRRALCAAGAQALQQKYGIARIEALTASMKADLALNGIRRSIQAALATQRETTSGDPLSLRMLFLLRGPAGGGGAHSVLQEAAEMHRLGTTVRVAVEPDLLPAYLRAYRDQPEAATILAGWDETVLASQAAGFDVAIATICTSVRLLEAVATANPAILPAYYVQDYEPLFYEPGSPTREEALDSYTRLPGALLFAKTGWVAAQVESAHGLPVVKVQPGIDLALYRPLARQPQACIKLAAMIRPQTPRRAAQRTMRVLARVAERLASSSPTVEIALFGCDSDDPQFAALPREFQFENRGVLCRPEVAALLQQSDLFIDLSDYQAFGRTALEAMACGCAAVVPVHGGCDEYAIDGVNALVVDSHDEAQCIERICSLLRDRAALQGLQLAGSLTASRFGLRGAALSILHVAARGVATRQPPMQKVPARDALQCARDPAPVLERAQATPPLRHQESRLPLTVLVLSWDVGHNPVGRSYMLAEVLNRVVRNVVLAGFGFERYGSQVWEPVRDARLPVIRMPASDTAGLLTQVDRIAQRVKPDIVIACKPRMPSLQLAAAIKHRTGCPLILDIDDHELAFFNGAQELSLAGLSALPAADPASEASLPFGRLWTSVAQHMRRFADEILVSNVALHRQFGGTVLPHVRDETVFDPALYSRQLSRLEYGIAPQAKVILFFGTPRLHKGIDALAVATSKLHDPAWRLVIVGSSTDRSVTNGIEKLAPGRVSWLPNQPFDAIARVLAMADVVCLPQDESHPVSHYQLPAKAIDAIGMGVPLLVTGTAPLMQLVHDGVAIAVERDQLAQAIERAVDASGQWARQVRPAFLAHYSHDAAARTLRTVLKRVLDHADPMRTDDLPALVRQQRRLLGLPGSAAPRRPPAGRGRDVVMFWKQNDSGIYGRRVDMVARYLASRSDVRRVLLIDAPISEHDLLRLRDAGGAATQDRLIYTRSYEKQFGLRDDGKLSCHVFIYQPGTWRTGTVDNGRAPLTEGYTAWLAQLFDREKVDPSKSIFWIYPRNYHAPALLQRFRPYRTVVDIVDDHRAWPGVSSEEKARLSDNYRDTLARADMAFVNCASMQQEMAQWFDGLRLVPNGCDLSMPAGVPVGSPCFDALRRHAGKVIGYVGNLESKIDLVLLKKIALRFPECKLALLGSTHANPAVLELQDQPNVLLPGIVPYDLLAAWMERFDVGIIPHLDTPLTRSMNPLKLYVYLAHRLPVVSSCVSNVDASAPCVTIGASHEDFLARLQHVLDSGRVAGAKQDAYIRSNSWAARLAPHVDLLLEPLHHGKTIPA